MRSFTAATLLAGLAVGATVPGAGLEKRDGTISVNAYSATNCAGTNQGGMKIGTSGKCQNFSNAQSILFHDSDSKNCDTITAQYYVGTDCNGAMEGEFSYTAGNCDNLTGAHGSAFLQCINT